MCFCANVERNSLRAENAPSMSSRQKLNTFYVQYTSLDSSVGIATGYGLDDRIIWVLFPARTIFFNHSPVPTAEVKKGGAPTPTPPPPHPHMFMVWCLNKLRYNLTLPVTVAEQSKACTVFARSEAGIVSSNPTQGMVV
jgi:hypothetical protein